MRAHATFVLAAFVTLACGCAMEAESDFAADGLDNSSEGEAEQGLTALHGTAAEESAPDTREGGASVSPDADPENEPAEFCTPSVSSVSPTTAYLDQYTAFTVYGNCLPQTLAFWIANCDGVGQVGVTSSQAVFACTPRWNTGNMPGVVKTQPSGTTLKLFNVLVK